MARNGRAHLRRGWRAILVFRLFVTYRVVHAEWIKSLHLLSAYHKDDRGRNQRINCEMLAELIRGVEHRKVELDRLRPLSGGALAQLQQYYDNELTYTSNAIEGNTLTHRETAEVIEHGITVGGKSLREHLEAVDHYEALQWMRGLAAQTAPI